MSKTRVRVPPSLPVSQRKVAETEEFRKEFSQSRHSPSYHPTRDIFTKRKRDVTPTSSNNLFVAARVLLLQPDKDTVAKQDDALIKSMESPRTRVVVQPCHRAVCHTLEQVVAMIPNKNHLTEARLGMIIMAHLRSSNAAMDKVNKDSAAIQMRFHISTSRPA